MCVEQNKGPKTSPLKNLEEKSLAECVISETDGLAEILTK